MKERDCSSHTPSTGFLEDNQLNIRRCVLVRASDIRSGASSMGPNPVLMYRVFLFRKEALVCIISIHRVVQTCTIKLSEKKK